jgi:DNA-binding LytR/AlgR family response regulator
MFNCIVVDDEKLARERITAFLEQQAGWQVIGEAAEYKQAKGMIELLQPDICFMDINIIGGSGVDLVRELAPKVSTQWAFTTAYSNFALQAFELDVIDYLLKPLEDKRLFEVLLKTEKRLASKPRRNKNILAVKSIGAVQFVNVEDIVWIKGSANYVELHCKDKMMLHRETLNKLEEQLDPLKFARVHRSAMVNLSKISSLSSELGRYSLLQLANGDEVKISQAHKTCLFQQLGLDNHQMVTGT